MMALISKLQREEDGQTMAEYAVVLAVITLLVVVALTSLSDAIVAALDNVTGIIGESSLLAGEAPRRLPSRLPAGRVSPARAWSSSRSFSCRCC